jgi:hypothetical protein
LSKTSDDTADLVHALDLLVLREWDAARDVLEKVQGPVSDRLLMLANDLQARDRERAQLLATTRHEIGNALAIALANMEGVIDGVVEPTPARRNGIREALVAAGERLELLGAQPMETGIREGAQERVDAVSLVRDQAAFVDVLARAKHVTMSLAGADRTWVGDPVRIAANVREALVSAVRRTAPGGNIVVRIVADGVAVEARAGRGNTST